MSDGVAEIEDVGYVVLRQVLTPGEVDELRTAFGPETPGATLHVDIDDEMPARANWLALAHHPQIEPLLSELLEEFDVRIHGREPGQGAGAQGLHADRPSGRMHDVDGITALWMLDDFHVDNGATRVVPRSHRGAAAVPRNLAQPSDRHPDELIVTGAAGDVLVFDAHLWHSGRENTSGARRRAVQMTATRSTLML